MRWRLLVATFIICLLSVQSVQAETEPTFRSYITGEGGKNRPRGKAQTDFECSDTIYIVVEVTAPVRQEPSDHLLVVNWLNPNDKLQEKTRIEFKSYGKGTRVWAWLRLSGSTGAAIGQVFDPSFGMSQFIGKWRADVSIDDTKTDTHHFDVLC